MYPYLTAEIAAAHVADLRREAAARCWASQVTRRPLPDRLRTTLRGAVGPRRTTTRTTPVCCPA